MAALFFLSHLLCGDDVHRLGSDQFCIRWPAHQRLERLGWLAYPALLRGSRCDHPERAERCGVLLDRLDGWLSDLVDVEGVVRGVDRLPAGASDAFMRAVCRRVDMLGGWTLGSDSWVWVRSGRCYRYEREQDCRRVVGEAAARRDLGLFFPLVPVGK